MFDQTRKYILINAAHMGHSCGWTPKIGHVSMDIAEKIRKTEMDSIRAQVERNLQVSVLKSLDERGGAQELVRQQYSGRYPFELLQNANDAALDSGIMGRAVFLLTQTALIVADNGSGFGEKQVEAICSLGRSSKRPGTSVGHKGLGFKSVGEITDRPQIISLQTSFQFNGERVRQEVLGLLGSIPKQQKFPVYAFPFPVENHDLGEDAEEVEQLRADGWTTVVRLPLRPGVAKETVAGHLVESLLPRLLLFLRGMEHLELRGTHGDFSVEVSRASDSVGDQTLLEVRGQLEEWRIYRDEVAPGRAVMEPMGDGWTEIETVQFAVAVPIGADGAPRVDETFPLHVYFPTEEQPGTHLAIHAEWALSMDRKQLAGTPEASAYNKMLLQHVAAFIADTVAVDLTKNYQKHAETTRSLLPAAESPTPGAAAQFRHYWCESLSEASFLPLARYPQLQTPKEIWLLPRSLPSFVDAHELADLDPWTTLRIDIESLDSVRSFLASMYEESELGIHEFLQRLKPPSHSNLDLYYSFLIEWRDVAGQTLLRQLGSIPSVLTTNNDLLAPKSETIFMPRMRGDATALIDIPVPIANVPDVEGVDSFLRELGVKPFEWRDLIREFLVKILENPQADEDERTRAMTGLRSYQMARLSGSEDVAQLLSRVLLPARSAEATIKCLRPGGELYFDSTWTDSGDLESIYGPFGAADFLDTVAPEDSDKKQLDLDFYRMLGVKDHPRLNVAVASDKTSFLVGGYSHPHRSPTFRDWMNHPETQDASSCPQGHPQKQQLKTSVILDRQLELAEAKDPQRLLAFWNQLARRWGSTYEPAMESIFRCVHSSHSGERERSCESLFAYILRSKPWVPVATNQIVTVVRPQDAWIVAPDTPRHIEKRISRINESMYKTRGGYAMSAVLGLTDAARPGIQDLLEILEGIADEVEALGQTNPETRRSARYVQRILNDVISDDVECHSAPENVRLLARFQGNSSLIARPVFADDPFLRKTWEAKLYVLDAESGLTQLTRFLGLTRLDDVVSTTPRVSGPHLDDLTYAAVQRKINRVKPYILALVRSENSTAENTVRPALRKLELVICDHLVLEYEHNGASIERDDAVCFIASTQLEPHKRSRKTGTAYLELDDTGQPHWFPFGRQLAQYMGIPALADAITMLFTASAPDLERMMSDRQIQVDDIRDAQNQLQLEFEEEAQLSNVLDEFLAGAHTEEGATTLLTTNVTGVVAIKYPEVTKGEDTIASTAMQDDDSVVPDRIPAQQVDYESLEIVDASLNNHESKNRGIRRTGTVIHGSSSAPSIQETEENRRVGLRGEEIAYNAERRRLSKLGKNPDLAIWVSKTDELSPFDIKSVDGDNQIIYIEVKSTKSSVPSDPFFISQAELVEATFYRERYYIYRVTSVDTARPIVTRVSDPLRLIRVGRGSLQLANALMSLAFETHAEGNHQFALADIPDPLNAGSQ